MATRLVQINMKARDDSALGGFWAGALGWQVSSEGPGVTNLEPVGFVYPDPVAVCIDLVASAEPKTVKNRVHVDLAATSAAHQAELVARLMDLGATRADIGQGDVPWTVMADPEGNEFCVLDSRYQDTGPIAAVVVDCVDLGAVARFWSRAMDWNMYTLTDRNVVLRSAAGVGPYPDDDQEAEAARLHALGATTIDIGRSDVSWTVLADPEGNEFCLLAPG